MNGGLVAVLVAFLAASVRALGLWRDNLRVDVVNTVVLTMFGEGRAADLGKVLDVARGAPYRIVAESLAEAATQLSVEESWVDRPKSEVQQWLDDRAMRSLALANRRLRRQAWLDLVALAAVLVGGISGALTGAATTKLALLLFAVTLFWLSNVLTVRSISTRMYAGATTLAEGLAELVTGASGVALGDRVSPRRQRRS